MSRSGWPGASDSPCLTQLYSWDSVCHHAWVASWFELSLLCIFIHPGKVWSSQVPSSKPSLHLYSLDVNPGSGSQALTYIIGIAHQQTSPPTGLLQNAMAKLQLTPLLASHLSCRAAVLVLGSTVLQCIEKLYVVLLSHLFRCKKLLGIPPNKLKPIHGVSLSWRSCLCLRLRGVRLWPWRACLCSLA